MSNVHIFKMTIVYTLHTFSQHRTVTCDSKKCCEKV